MIDHYKEHLSKKQRKQEEEEDGVDKIKRCAIEVREGE